MKTARFLAFLTAIAIAGPLLAPAPALAQGAGDRKGIGDYLRNKDDKVKLTINVDLEDADLREAMEQIGRRVGKNILVDPTVNERITVSLYDIPWRDAVDVIARMTKCEVEEKASVLILTQPPKVTIQFTEANIRVVLQLLAAYSGKNIIIHPQVTGDITLDLKEVRWDKALKAIVKTAGPYEVVEDSPDLLRVVPSATIATQLRTVHIPLKFVRPPLAYRARPTGSLGQGTSGGAANIFLANQTPPPADPLVGFTLYRALDGIVQANRNTAQGSTLQYDSRTNSFIVTATDVLIGQIREIIQRIDVEPAQLYIEVRFITTKDNNFFENGITFGGADPSIGLNMSGPFPSGQTASVPLGSALGPSLATGQAATTTVTGAPTGVARPLGTLPFIFGESRSAFQESFSIPAFLDFRGLNMALNLIDRDERSRVVQAPSLYMLDNEDATIFVGENVPYAEFSSTPDINGNVIQTVRAGANSPVQVGFSLFLSPHVVPDTDRIMLTVIPRVNELTGITSPISGFDRFQFGALSLDLPRTREQAMVTHVMLDDGQTAVLGGLLTEADVEIVKKIPILSDIPLLGNLFTNKRRTKRVENLVVFITPTLVRSRSQAQTLFKRADKQLKDRDYFYNKFEKPPEGAPTGPGTTPPTTDPNGEQPPREPGAPGATKLEGEPARVEKRNKPEAPKTEQPKTETPVTPEAPKTEAPKTEAPKTETPMTPEAPKTETPAAPTPEAPKTETPGTPAPTPEAPKTDAPPADAPKTEPGAPK